MTEPVFSMPHVSVYQGDCLDVLRELPEASVHSIVTDPPYDLTSGKRGGSGLASVNLDSPYGRARIGTVAENVERYGTGALNIDGTRIPTDDLLVDRVGERTAEQRYVEGGGTDFAAKPGRRRKPSFPSGDYGSRGLYGADGHRTADRHPEGRWPANVLLDEEAAALLDEQSGVSNDGVAVNRNRNAETSSSYDASSYFIPHRRAADVGYGGRGGASRFFYVAKASKKDRGAGNIHPTVKPVALMRHLIRLVTPPNGVVLDPFAGSGTTLVAAISLGFRSIGIEREPKYVRIIERRCAQLALEVPA